MARIPNVPSRSEVGGYVNQQRAMDLLGLQEQSRGYLHSLVKEGKIEAAYFDDRTLMYERASLEAYAREHPADRRRGRVAKKASSSSTKVMTTS